MIQQVKDEDWPQFYEWLEDLSRRYLNNEIDLWQFEDEFLGYMPYCVSGWAPEPLRSNVMDIDCMLVGINEPEIAAPGDTEEGLKAFLEKITTQKGSDDE